MDQRKSKIRRCYITGNTIRQSQSIAFAGIWEKITHARGGDKVRL